MNKTIIININGIVFHIEEDAYEVLKSYMTDVKRHFANEEDSIEITTDIENRIAEMFSEILNREVRQVVVTADVTTVISQMGTIEDFETTEQGPQGAYGHQTFTDNRKLFRDPDNHLFGGVCSGIANYFDIDTVWVRLAFVLACFGGGAGLLAYIIMWIIVPKAMSRADRMAMKGERLDLKGFARNFEEELKNVQHTINNAGHHAKPFVYKARDFFGDFADHLGYFLRGVSQFFLKFIGVIILLFCFGFMIAAVVALAFIVAQGKDVLHLFPFSIINHNYSQIIYFSAFAVVIIPLISLVMVVLRGIFNSNHIGRSTGYTLLILWIVAISLFGYFSSKVAADFRDYASISQNIDIKTPTHNTYYLKLNDVKYLSKEDSIQLNINDHFKGKVILNDDEDDDEISNRHENRPQSLRIYIEKSDVTTPLLIEEFSARGSSEQDALHNAQATTYFFNQADSVLSFDRAVTLARNVLWRNQQVKITLKVPQNSTLVIEHKMERYIQNASLYDCIQANKQNDDATTAIFTMTNNGLQCKVDTAVVKADTATVIEPATQK
jgi:phage shock protein PspC (stress-responsive transcriptional regulator)